MENIERNQFVVLTGHLDEQPLPDIIRRLRVQRKTGRLQVEYPDGPGSFFFEDGKLVDAQLGRLRGVEAVYAALALEGASFNFNPLVKPPERNIDKQGQQFVWDLIEGPRRQGLTEIKAAGRELDGAPPQSAPLQLPAAAELVAPLEVRLTAVEEAINNTSRRFSRERLVYAITIGFLTGLCLVAVLNVLFDPFRPEPAQTSAPAVVKEQPAVGPAGSEPGAPTQAADSKRQDSDSKQKEEATAGQNETPVPSTAALIGTRKTYGGAAPRGAQVVQVLVEVQNGRVTAARVWNPRPGAGAYESVALKMARERSYPVGFTGGEMLKIRVKP